MSRSVTYRESLYEALREEMERDASVILMGEDIVHAGGAFGVAGDLWSRFGPQRVIQTPISENSFVGTAVGAAMTGLRPVVEIMFMDFITLAMDQIVNHAAKIHYMYAGQYNVPLVIRTPAGAGRGYGASHSQSLESWFLHVPGLKVVAPSDPADAKALLKSAIRDDNPVLFIEN
jgi:pyruvate/2-oxoglutarate/acetoin dehydrogenase E1 component